MRYENRMSIIKFIQGEPYGLSEYLATKYYSDAINFFYLDIKIKKQAWRNMIADDLSRSAALCLKTAKSSKDLDIYKNIKLAEYNARQLNEPEKEDIPDSFYKKPYKVYTLDSRKVGREPENRNVLAAHIDSLNIPEADKLRVKRDAMIEDVNFLEDYEDKS